MLIAPSVIKQIADYVKIRLISKLINGFSRIFQTCLKYFNGTIILTFFVPSLPILPDIIFFNLNKSLLLPAAGGSIIAPLLFKAGSSL